MRHKTFIGFLFGLTAIAVALYAPIRDAQAQQMVECKEGKCVISEADWKQLQAFHKKRMEFEEELLSNREDLANALNRCMAHQAKRPA